MKYMDIDDDWKRTPLVGRAFPYIRYSYRLLEFGGMYWVTSSRICSHGEYVTLGVL